jgi:hypothetical protein
MALKSTLDAVRAICAADPSLNAPQIKAALAELNGEGVREMRGEPPPRAYTPAQVAELLGKSRRTISAYARRGLLTPIYSGETGARAQGYTGESVAALLSGKAKAKGSEVAA